MGIIESVQQYDLNIPAGGAQNIDVAGDRIQFLSAIDPFAQIEIRPNFAQGNISLRPGQGFKFSEQVTRWVVFNRGAVPLSGFLLIGSGDFFDQRIAGTVDVIDGGKARTLAGIAFGGVSYSQALAGQISHVQLWNPAGSGKNLFVEQVYAQFTGVSSAQFVQHNAPLSVLSALQPASKMLGAAGSVAKLYVQQSAASIGAVNPVVTLGAGNIFQPKEPIVIPPGYGLVVRKALVNEDIQGGFEWFEEVF